uniref:Nuclear pore protein n=1 Tax=Panagrolaimus sp. JU765 TaxID=591449 RepID=A0AC34QP27_9BILA
MSRNFGDLLNRTDELNSSMRFDAFKQLSKPNTSFDIQAPKSATEYKLSQFQDIFKSSEEIWKKKRLDDGEQLNRSGFGVSSIFKKDEPSRFELTTNGIPKNYDVNSLQAIEGFVEDSIKRTRLEAERMFLNQHVIEMDLALASKKVAADSAQDKFVDGRIKTKFALPLNTFIENTFAEKMDKAVKSGGFTKVLDGLKAAVKEVNESSITSIWDTVFSLCKTVLLKEGESISEYRNSKDWMKHVVENATEHFQTEYRRYMENLIESNLEQAQRGGTPGTLPLIEAYLNVANLNYGKFMNDFYGSHPIWCVLFHALRLGDYKAASTVADVLSTVPSVSILVLVLHNLAKGESMDHSTRIKLYAEWNHEERTCTDPYKHAIYGLILDFESEDVNNNIENWLWSKLVSAKLDQQHGFDRFQNLQRLVALEYGEAYFMDDKSGGNPVLYFTVLFLTGQLERAIEVLQRAGLIVFSTHIAILCYTLKMIILTGSVRDDILVCDPGSTIDCKINFAKLLILYVKRFELVNISYALSYCYFLNNLQFESNKKQEGSLFEACVSRLVHVTGERDAILGKLQPDGSRIPGLLDEMAHNINVADVIARVALDTSLNGDNITACIIYCIAGRPNDAISLMNRQLSNCIAALSPVTEKAVALAEKLIKRYNTASESVVQKQKISTLRLLIQCYHIFRLAKENSYKKVVEEAEQMCVVPLDPDVVTTEVENFKMLPEEVISLLPEFCLTLMTAIVENYKQADPKTKHSMQSYAKAVLLYSAMIPHRFPTQIASKLLQMQTQIS